MPYFHFEKNHAIKKSLNSGSFHSFFILDYSIHFYLFDFFIID